MKPTKSLLEGKEYTPASKTDIRKLFARVRREQKQAKEIAERQHLRIIRRA